MTHENIAIIIPALNEEAALRSLLAELPHDFAHWIIVVDNGSTDRTAEVAHAAGVMLVEEPARGYGQACWKGFQTARELGAEILIFLDGDGSDDPADLPLMVRSFYEQQADLVIGSRVTAHAERGAILPHARLGNWLVSRLVYLFYKTPVHDIGSFRVVRCAALAELAMREMTFGWPVEMLVKAARAGYRIVEVPIHYRRRSHGRSKVAGTISGSIRTACSMLRTTLRHAF